MQFGYAYMSLGFRPTARKVIGGAFVLRKYEVDQPTTIDEYLVRLALWALQAMQRCPLLGTKAWGA